MTRRAGRPEWGVASLGEPEALALEGIRRELDVLATYVAEEGAKVDRMTCGVKRRNRVHEALELGSIGGECRYYEQSDIAKIAAWTDLDDGGRVPRVRDQRNARCLPFDGHAAIANERACVREGEHASDVLRDDLPDSAAHDHRRADPPCVHLSMEGDLERERRGFVVACEEARGWNVEIESDCVERCAEDGPRLVEPAPHPGVIDRSTAENKQEALRNGSTHGDMAGRQEFSIELGSIRRNDNAAYIEMRSRRREGTRNVCEIELGMPAKVRDERRCLRHERALVEGRDHER
jgi:hypothetical protein